MKTSSDRQPFYCQNTFYKQFMSVFHLIYLQDLKTYPVPILCHPSEERGQQIGPIATLGHKTIF